MGSLSSMCHDLEQERIENTFKNSTITKTEIPVFWDTINTYSKVEIDNITEAVIDDLRSRSDRGIKKYNTTLDKNNHQNMLQHAYEEALDMAQYLKKEITTLNTIQDLVKQYSNNQELGAKIREMFSNG